jgi:hypothetical protein
MTNPIHLSNAKRLDLDLALASESFDELDSDCAAYISWIFHQRADSRGQASSQDL